MTSEFDIRPDFDWHVWAERWERMQERYLVARAERFAVMIRMIRATMPAPAKLLDLGCGPGSLSLALLEQFPEAHVVGIDFDPTMLLLAKLRLAQFGPRAELVSADLRQPTWQTLVVPPFDAIVSATALHWLSPQQLTDLYNRIGQILRPEGVFLNADHVGSDFEPIQQAWDKHRDELRSAWERSSADDWDEFWKGYGQALGWDMDSVHKRLWGDQSGVENGLSLPWHFHALKESGFRYVDCFWRSDGDAVYGGVRANARE